MGFFLFVLQSYPPLKAQGSRRFLTRMIIAAKRRKKLNCLVVYHIIIGFIRFYYGFKVARWYCLPDCFLGFHLLSSFPIWKAQCGRRYHPATIPCHYIYSLLLHILLKYPRPGQTCCSLRISRLPWPLRNRLHQSLFHRIILNIMEHIPKLFS